MDISLQPFALQILQNRRRGWCAGASVPWADTRRREVVREHEVTIRTNRGGVANGSDVQEVREEDEGDR